MSNESEGVDQESSLRKHLYLITEHDEDDRVGGVSITDSRLSRPTKNEEGPITVLDEQKEGFRHIGKKVGLGYHDFEGESAYADNEHVADVIQRKIRSVDRHWAEKAGIDEVVYDV